MSPRRFLTSALLFVALASPPALRAQTAPAGASSRFQAYVDWLADDARQGRGPGTAGLAQAGRWVVERMREIDLEPGNEGSFLQPIEFEGAFNVVGRLTATAPESLPGVVVVGAHYDHLGYGGPNSLDAATQVIHNGADDNASGIAALLLVAQQLVAQKQNLRRDIYFVAFTGEESGNLGSGHFTRSPPPGLAIDDVVAMINMDMVGRLRDDTVEILGARSADEWPLLLQPLCEQAALHCSLDGSGYGPSDHTPFHKSGVPVLHFFTGPHDDFHTSADDSHKINAEGGARVARLVAATAASVANRVQPLSYQRVDDHEHFVGCEHGTDRSARDALHVTVMRTHGVAEIMTFAAGFDRVSDLRRIH